MGMDVGKKSGGMNSEINITPLADVMLVLLIIVMLIAPLLQAGVTLTLPEAANTADKPDNDSNLVIAVTADGRYFVDNVETLENALLDNIRQELDVRLEEIVMIKGDVNAQYSAIMSLMDQLQRGGIENVALITERDIGGAAGGGGE
jgi:biopolymer transport protein ExbD|tara:strand:+ start:750 stop:1190 length:441 start_codon:yes stop_codon:yes gene_type:complete